MLKSEDNIHNLHADITALILTYNEEKHIERCIFSIRHFVKRIVIIDSFSNDNTLNILKKYNVEILQNRFINQSKQFNWEKIVHEYLLIYNKTIAICT